MPASTFVQVSELNERLRPRNITLKLSDGALDHAVREAYDPVYGARPLRRWLEHRVITALSRMIVAGELPDFSTVEVDVTRDKGSLSYNVKKSPEAARLQAEAQAKRARWDGADADREVEDDEIMEME